MKILFRDLSFLANRDLMCVGPFATSKSWAVFGNVSYRKLTNTVNKQQDIWPVKIGSGKSLEEVMIWSDLEQFKIVDVRSPDAWRCSYDYQHYLCSPIKLSKILYATYSVLPEIAINPPATR